MEELQKSAEEQLEGYMSSLKTQIKIKQYSMAQSVAFEIIRILGKIDMCEILTRTERRNKRLGGKE